MQKEKIALIALVIIVVAALCTFMIAINTDIFENLFKERKTLVEGDCADVSYIGRYASNNTIFDTSYEYANNKTGGMPLKIFASFDPNETSWKSGYTSGMIKGFMEGIIGMKEGETKIIGPIPPEDAYGILPKLKVGDSFTTSNITATVSNITFDQTVTVVSLDSENITLKWVDIEMNKNFTLPEAVLLEDLSQAYFSLYDYLPPYYIWENSSQIINVTEDTALIKITPTRAQNITENVTFISVGTQFSFIFPDATTAVWNDSKITILSSPVAGSEYIMPYQGLLLNITVNDLNETNINITVENQGQNQTVQLDRIITINTTYAMRRIYTIPLMYADFILTYSLENAGFSLNPLSGEELKFEVTVENVYKQAQTSS